MKVAVGSQELEDSLIEIFSIIFDLAIENLHDLSFDI
jgi:hypothetical protein